MTKTFGFMRYHVRAGAGFPFRAFFRYFFYWADCSAAA